MFRLFTIQFPFYFFASFRFKFFPLLHFSSFRFEAKQSEAKFKCIFSLFFAFFRFFRFFCLKFFASLWFSNFRFGWKKSILSIFSFIFCFASIFSLNFCLFYLRFRFRFLVFRIEVNHVKSGFLFASKRNEIFASISNFVSEAKVRAHPIHRPACSSMSLLFWVFSLVKVMYWRRPTLFCRRLIWLNFPSFISLPWKTVQREERLREIYKEAQQWSLRGDGDWR